MNILIPDSWLRKYLQTNATPKQIQESLSLCGPSIERITQTISDTIYDIEVTTNRVDCMSVLGIAREAAAILPQFGYQAKLLSDPLMQKTKLNLVPKVSYLDLKLDSSLCPRFTAILIRNISVKPSPDDIAAKLNSVGMRPLNNVIDVTNLLMHELGQPLHVFDYDHIKDHKMILRSSRAGETVTTLDGKTHTLPGDDIVIEDGSGQLIDLCGIMGGLSSSVTEHTKNVLLFVQTYSKNHIRRTSMSLSHRTGAAVLFEKGLPVELVPPTLAIATKLIAKLSGGKPDPQVLDVLSIPENLTLTLTLTKPIYSLASKLIGVSLNSAQVSDILKRLNFKVSSQTIVRIPFYRTDDIQIPEDLVEEIARLYGYYQLPPVLMSGSPPPPKIDTSFYWENRIKTTLKYLGFNEIYSYSLVKKDSGLKLKNPLTSDWYYLRTSLFPSHQLIVDQNEGKISPINIFEIANVYLPAAASLPQEQLRLLITSTHPDNYYLKGIIETLLHDLGIFDLLPEISQSQGIFYWEIPLSELTHRATDTKSYTPISKFTPIIEDINVPLPKKYSELVQKLRRLGPLITDVKLIDKYQNKLTLRLTFHAPDRQLSDSDIQPLRSQLSKISLSKP